MTATVREAGADTDRREEPSPEHSRSIDSAAWRMGLVVVATAVGYQFSLRSLWGAWRSDSPLAYLGVVPFVAMMLLWTRRHPDRGERQIHDRQVDYLLSVPLVLVAMFVLQLSRSRNSTLFWVHRFDLLSLPVFVGGLIGLLLGSRAVWRARASLGLLLLAWPPLAHLLLGDPVAWLTGHTAVFVGEASSIMGIAVPTYQGGRATLHTTGSHFLVVQPNAGSAAAVVAFIAIGLGACFASHRHWRIKFLWLAAGSVVVWSAETVRILAAVAAGNANGHYPTWLLSPGAAIAVLALIVAPVAAGATIRRPTRLPVSPPPLIVASYAGRLRRDLLATVVVALSVAGVGVEARALPSLAAVADPLGDVRLAPLSASLASGVVPSRSATQRPSLLFLPTNASWNRWNAGPEVIDVVGSSRAADLGVGRLTTWFPIGAGVQSRSTTVDLGHGVVAALVSYRQPGSRFWLGLTWVWPVTGAQKYEQVLVLPSSLSSDGGPVASQRGWLAPSELGGSTNQMEATGRALVTATVTHPSLKATDAQSPVVVVQ